MPRRRAGQTGYGPIDVVESRRTPVVPDGVLGMLLFVFAEATLFAGLISAFAIAKAGAPVWPPLGQPRLPVEATAINTAALVASGLLLMLSRRRFKVDRVSAEAPFVAALGLGTFFVLFQGYEWVSLIGQGLTMRSSALGSFFYLIVGVHALHAIAALGLLFVTWRRMRRGWLASSQLATAEVFWYFVVGIWPLIYLIVYL